MRQSYLFQVISQLAVLTSARLLGAVCVFLVSLMITRSFGAEVMAHYSLYLAAASIISVILPLGFHAIASMIIAEYNAEARMMDQHAFIGYGHRLIALMAVALIAVALCFLFFVPASSHYQLSVLTLMTIPAAIAMAYTYFNAGTLIGLQHQYSGQLPDMALRPLLLLAGIGLLVYFHIEATILQVLLISSFAIWVAAIVQWWALRRAIRHKDGATCGSATEGEPKKWWQLAPGWVVINILWEYFVEVHMLIAGFLVLPQDVALLYVCFRLRQLAGFGFMAIESIIFPKVFAANTRNDMRETTYLIRLFTRTALGYAVCAVIGAGMIGPYVLAIFGDEFIKGQSILVLLFCTLIPRAMFGPASIILGMHRHTTLVAFILGLSLIISLFLCFVGFQFGGLAMIAIGYLVASLFTAIAMWYMAMRKSGINCAIWA